MSSKSRKSQYSLTKWTNADWGYVGRGSRYLPKSVRRRLSKAERNATNRRKATATRQGRSRAKYSDRIRSLVRKTRQRRKSGGKKSKIAVKANPRLWKRSVREALKSHDGKYSARMFQLATRNYQKAGGKYIDWYFSYEGWDFRLLFFLSWFKCLRYLSVSAARGAVL